MKVAMGSPYKHNSFVPHRHVPVPSAQVGR